MLRYVHWLAPLIALGVAVYIAVFMFRVNQTDPLPLVKPVPLGSGKSSTSPQAEKQWLDALAANERQGYFYPVNEIYIDLDLDQKFVHEKTYRLSASLRDPLQLFCLKQELKQHHLRYTLKQQENGAELLVYSKDQSELEALVNTLKNYQITATFLPYEEDQRWKNIK
jgi:hypothetical protein